ncbi:hypothetical protein Thimo_3448 [Thioflavicoccus mobilis 8321]|uniref:Uncharacterized protein n=1 Tax=Thioflavicoccus mobilis 8321 TaxID=765912 RepID=L0GZD2_9GAMM|nr:hypothetical protein [Thioflavicoccus mobilis]AGA92113.1 hypothetical protein Thimo_3448 [Thioflavicoccus mobilis 8321]
MPGITTTPKSPIASQGDPILEVSAPQQALLVETDLAAGLPERFLCCSYPTVHIALAHPCPLTHDQQPCLGPA